MLARWIHNPSGLLPVLGPRFTPSPLGAVLATCFPSSQGWQESRAAPQPWPGLCLFQPRSCSLRAPHKAHTGQAARVLCWSTWRARACMLGWDFIAQHHHVLSEAQVFPSPAAAPSMSCRRALLTALRTHPTWVLAPGLAPRSSSYLKSYPGSGQLSLPSSHVWGSSACRHLRLCSVPRLWVFFLP